MSPTPARFRDPRRTAYDFLDPVLVRCPRCARMARVEPQPGAEPKPTRWPHFTPRRLVCLSCGLARGREANWVALNRDSADARDPYFRLPLWLQTRTRHGHLWAYNLEHLDLIRRFAAASLRERAPWYDVGVRMTLVARLPVWIKRGRNRAEVLRAVDRVRGSVTSG
ncbi:hypothetical protein [Streptomyces sp. B93]|uniref:hypothetical protein n=1 Tax=Streptomyces sp. B93 TaxID=2824875 RepID=UPI001B393E14|nr:hypothetical protein [Streptomyces sp. B93]MBQ1089947.1 hypothetical protein [Streptomyces sp. B93]